MGNHEVERSRRRFEFLKHAAKLFGLQEGRHLVGQKAAESRTGNAGCQRRRVLVEFKITLDRTTQLPAPVVESTPRQRVIGHAHAVGRKAGFVRVGADGTLTVADFLGSFFFNTWGNLAVDARAGLLFRDFEKCEVRSLVVTADIVWEDAEVAHFAGARRLRFTAREMRRIAASLPLRWGLMALSPVLEASGRWSCG